MISAGSALELKPRFTREDLRDLVRAEDGWRLSLFMPLVRTGRDVHQAPILLKDLRAKAAADLEARRAPPAARDEILSAVDQILRDTDASVLQGEGLAIFASTHAAFSYLLPVKPEASATVARRFRLEPILPLLYEDGGFYLLALGLKDVRLFEGDRIRLSELSLDGVPTDLRTALRFEDSESYLSLHSTPSTSMGGGRGAPIFHGHGGGKGDLKEMKRDILRFFQHLDRGIRPLLADPARPLLLSGAEAMLPIYREANTHPRTLDVSLPAHLDRLSGLAELHSQAWSLCDREAKASRKAMISLYRERLASPWATAGIANVVPTAHQGRVSHLFVRRGYRSFGSYDVSEARVHLSDLPQDGDEELATLAAVQTIMGSGKVFVTEPGEIPEGAEIAALCRY